MTAIISLLLILVLSVLVTRISTIALIHTGLSLETARFQARSAFTGAGFTTTESERIVTHPVRRRIIMGLMLIGNAGLVTAVASLMLTFIGDQSVLDASIRVSLIAIGITALWALTMSQWVEQKLSRVIEWALQRYTHLDVQDYAALMHVADDYRISELAVRDDDWLAGKSLRESRLRDEGLIVLGIERQNGKYEGAPQPETRMDRGDRLLIYGRAKNIEHLDNRRSNADGEREHKRAVARFREECA